MPKGPKARSAPPTLSATRSTLCGYLLSGEEYSRLKKWDRRSYATEELPERLVEDFIRAEMDGRFDNLNKLMD